ncbi:MAG: hypothetical protein M3071_07650 [Actinomycetota bacterium]|nr:hypothetical protein [Actinomycetota bacterium]
MIAAALCLCLTACGSAGHSPTSGGVARQPQTTSAAVSTDPYRRQIDAMCGQVMPAIHAAVTDARQVMNGTASGADLATVGLAVRDVVSLDLAYERVTAPRLGLDTYAPVPHWLGADQAFYASLEYFVDPASGPTTPVAAAGHIVQQAQVVSGYAALAQVPHCEPDVPVGSRTQNSTSPTAPASTQASEPPSTTPAQPPAGAPAAPTTPAGGSAGSLVPGANPAPLGVPSIVTYGYKPSAVCTTNHVCATDVRWTSWGSSAIGRGADKTCNTQIQNGGCSQARITITYATPEQVCGGYYYTAWSFVISNGFPAGNNALNPQSCVPQH